MNEFKFSSLRQFGSENVSFTATIKSDKLTLSEKEIQDQVDQVGILINKAFIGVQDREISEKALLAAASNRRTIEVAKLDAALKEEMEAKKHAGETMKYAERLSNKITKK
jgi:hypothetical protein